MRDKSLPDQPGVVPRAEHALPPESRKMALNELLSERSTAIWQAWRDRILEAYPAKSAELFKKGKDPFANPLGHTGTISGAFRN